MTSPKPESSGVTRANVRMKFYNRFLLLGFGALAGAGYFFVDGAVRWPHQQEVWNAYLELNPEGAPDDHHSAGHEADTATKPPEEFPQKEWDRVVVDNGWRDSVKPREVDEDEPASFGEPKGKPRTDWEIKQQFYCGGALTPIGLAFLLKVLLARGMWIESDGRGVTSSWGKGFQFDNVVEINKKKWRDKGLAYVKFRKEGGGVGSFTIDDLKFHREPTDTILYELEQAVGIDKILGGPPEPDPNAPPPEGQVLDEPA